MRIRCAARFAILLLPFAAPPAASAQSSDPTVAFGQAGMNDLQADVAAARRLAQAHKALDKARELAPEAASNAKVAKKMKGYAADAEGHAGAAITADPRGVGGYLTRAEARLLQDEYSDARADCSIAIQLTAEGAEGLRCFGIASIRMGEAREALVALARLQRRPEAAAQATEVRTAVEVWVAAQLDDAERRNVSAWLERNPAPPGLASRPPTHD